MSDLSVRLTKATALPLPGDHSSGIMIGIQRENKRLQPFLEVLIQCAECLQEHVNYGAGPMYDTARSEFHLTKLQSLLDAKEG